MAESGAVTRLLERWHAGDEEALNALVPLVYDELRRIADQRLRREHGPRLSLQPTELVHEAYLRLAHGSPIDLNDRKHFFAIAARLMRQILVDHARARNAGKRDAGRRVTLNGMAAPTPSREQQVEVLALDQALTRLEAIDARKARVVELRVFAGLQYDEIGVVMELSRATLDRDFRAARAWLYREMTA